MKIDDATFEAEIRKPWPMPGVEEWPPRRCDTKPNDAAELLAADLGPDVEPHWSDTKLGPLTPAEKVIGVLIVLGGVASIASCSWAIWGAR